MPEDDLICLAPLGERHLDATLRWYNDPELARLLNRLRPITEAEHRYWFEHLAQKPERHFAVERLEDGRHLGNVWLADIDQANRKAEVRIVMGDPEDRRRGCGPRAIRLVAEYAFGEMDLNRLYAYVLAFNPRAIGAFMRAGFSIEGTLKQDRWAGNAFSDAIVLGRLREAAPAA